MTVHEVGSVAELWRYPVKSMQGERLDRGRFEGQGLVGDRRYALRDPADGKILTAKRYGRLLEAWARTDDDGEVVISLDGHEVAASDPAVHRRLSEWLDHGCVLAPCRPDDVNEFEMSLDPEHPDLDVFSWPCPTGSFVDAATAHLLTDASLDAAAATHPEGRWDRRRFRPTVLVETAAGGDGGWVEDGWVGREVGLGGAAVLVDYPTIRCPMPPRAQPAGPGLAALDRDFGVSAALRDHHDSNLGVYATVTRPGDVAVGDPVTLGAVTAS